MRTYHVTASVIPLLAALSAFAVDASAQSRRPYAIVELPPAEARGCYYDRGEEFCGSYCYWEINGKRYCQRRLRDAHSQAGPQHYYYAEPRPGRYETHMK